VQYQLERASKAHPYPDSVLCLYNMTGVCELSEIILILIFGGLIEMKSCLFSLAVLLATIKSSKGKLAIEDFF